MAPWQVEPKLASPGGKTFAARPAPLRPRVVAIGEIVFDMLPSGARLGGAPANFAFHAAQAGGDACLISRLGADLWGRRARRQWAHFGLPVRWLQEDREHPTGRVEVRLRGGIPHYTIARESAWDYLAWRAALAGLARQADIVCFGTLAQRHPVARRTIRQFVAACPPAGLRLLDANLRRGYASAAVLEPSLRLANVLKLNATELRIVARVLGIEGGDHSRHDRAWRWRIATALLGRYPLRAVVITRGAAGCEVYPAPGAATQAGKAAPPVEPLVVPAPAVPVRDTIGAGDAFAAGFAVALWQSGDWRAAALAGNGLGAKVASQVGGM